MDTADIQHLAGLARIAVTDGEAQELATEFDSILSYVAQVTKISADASLVPTIGAHANVMREDEETHVPGEYTEALLDASAEREGRYVHVQKIFKEK